MMRNEFVQDSFNKHRAPEVLEVKHTPWSQELSLERKKSHYNHLLIQNCNKSDINPYKLGTKKTLLQDNEVVWTITLEKKNQMK